MDTADSDRPGQSADAGGPPPASPGVVRFLAFALTVLILTMARFVIPDDFSSASETRGWGLIFLLIFHVPVLVVI